MSELQALPRRERKEQLFIRAITEGRLQDRDLLLSYSVGEFYNEMSLFLEQNEKDQKALDKIKSKIK